VGTPVVSVFAPVVPVDRWRPWRVPHVVLGDQTIACRSCRARTCPRAEQHCVATLTAGDVIAALERLVGRQVDLTVSPAPRHARGAAR
jgi:hypothetical protein